MLKNRDSADAGFACADSGCTDGVAATSGVILVPVTVSGMTLRLLQFVDLVGLWSADGLCFAGRPADFDAVNARAFAQAEMQPPLILRAEATAARHFLRLPLAVPEDSHLSADGAAIARRAFKIEGDPLVVGRDGVFVEQRGAFLIGDDHVELAAVAKIAKRDRATVVDIGHADDLRDLLELARAVVDPDLLLLIARQAAVVHRRPVLRVGDDRGVAARHFRIVVPVTGVPVRRDIAVDQVDVLIPVVVQIAELRSPAPAADLDAQVARQIVELQGLARSPRARNPEVVALKQHAFLRDVRDVDRKIAAIEHIADRRRHPALRRKTDAGLITYLAKLLTAVVEEQLRDAVIIGDKQIGITRSAQIGRDRGQRPPARLDAELFGDFFKFTAAEIVEEEFAPAVLRVLETFGHHLRVFQIPQIDLLVVIPRDEEVKLAVAVVIEPERVVGVDPLGQPGLLAHARETFAAVVVEKIGTPPAIEKQVFIPVAVIIAPYRAHRDAGLARVQITDAHSRGNVAEFAVAQIAI